MNAPILIDGEERFDEGRARPVVNPARHHEVVGWLTAGNADDAGAAVAAARAAFTAGRS